MEKADSKPFQSVKKVHVQFSGYILETKLQTSEAFVILRGDAVGVDWGEGPPVPIPNTEVKLTFADNTLRVTAREDR